MHGVVFHIRVCGCTLERAKSDENNTARFIFSFLPQCHVEETAYIHTHGKAGREKLISNQPDQNVFSFCQFILVSYPDPNYTMLNLKQNKKNCNFHSVWQVFDRIDNYFHDVIFKDR